jgi:hypothetical protein
MTDKEKSKTPTRADWGSGRIAYAAHAQVIQDLLAKHWPLAKIYRELESQLGDLSYHQFVHHVRRNQLKAPEKEAVKPITSNLERGKDETPENRRSSAQPTRYRPGPKVPDPNELY